MTLRSLSKSAFLAPLVTACVVVALMLSAQAQGVLEAVSNEVEAIFENAKPAVVQVRSIQEGRTVAGSGFFIDDQGTVMTSFPVVGLSEKALIQWGDSVMDAEVVARDRRSGIAILRVEAKGNPYLKFGDSDQLRVASQVISVAYAFNLPLSPAHGSIQGFEARYRQQFFPTTFIRANVSVAPGQIGGPLLNAKGEVVGMLAVMVEPGHFSYSLPSNAAEKVLADIKKFGAPQHGWVGVRVMEEISPVNPAPRIIVTELVDDTPASRSGIQPRDRVVSINGRTIRSASDVLDAGFFAVVGDDVKVTVLRDGEEKTFAFKAIARPGGSSPIRPLEERTTPLQDRKAYNVKGE